MPISPVHAAQHRLRIGRIMNDPRQNVRARKQSLWNYILEYEIQSGTQFLVTSEGSLYAVIGSTGQVLQLPRTGRGGDKWFSYFHTLYGMSEHEDQAKFIYDVLRHYVYEHGTKVELRRFAVYSHETQTTYISAYDGRMFRIAGSDDIVTLPCGEDGVFFADDDNGVHCTPDIGNHGILLDKLTDLHFAASGLSGITPAQQKMALIIWIFSLAFPDLMPTKPILLLEGTKGSGKCLGRGTPVMMADGLIKPVEQISAGEQVMGPDSKPRNVDGVTVGHGPLYRITPTKGAAWVCNEDHILTVVLSGTTQHPEDRHQVIDVPLMNCYPSEWGTSVKGRGYAMQLRTPVTFPSSAVLMDPYFVGAWLGDGTCGKAEITSPEPEIKAFCKTLAAAYGLQLRVHAGAGCEGLCFTTGNQTGQARADRNPILNFVRTLIVNDEKRIPREYLINDERTRLDVLAGLLDTDGHYQGGYEIITKYAGLRDDILFLARSLGFAAYSTEKIGTIKSLGFKGLYHRITISGDLDRIPCKVPCKQAKPCEQVKNVLHVGFKIEAIGEGDYYGFTLDGDGRFLLGDFTVTHNTSAVVLLQLALMGISRPMILQRNKEDDFGVVLLRSPIALFDNTDSYIEWVPDAICAYCTAGVWTKRRLYSDDESMTIKPHAFIAIATRNPASFRRDDVADRCVILRLDRREVFTSFQQLQQGILDDRPRLFGEYLWYVGRIIEELRADTLAGTIAGDSTHRMADFAALGSIVGRVLGWEPTVVAELMLALQGERDAFVNEEDPLVDLLQKWVGYKARVGPGNVGRLVQVFQLHAELETLAQAHSIQWKDSARSLAQKLRSTHIEREFRVEQVNAGGHKSYRFWRHNDTKLALVE